MRLREMLEGATDYLMQLESPLLIFDEGDKLNDNVIHYFINIYNRMEGCCGIAFLSTVSYIERRLERGVACGKKVTRRSTRASAAGITSSNLPTTSMWR